MTAEITPPASSPATSAGMTNSSRGAFRAQVLLLVSPALAGRGMERRLALHRCRFGASCETPRLPALHRGDFWPRAALFVSRKLTPALRQRAPRRRSFTGAAFAALGGVRRRCRRAETRGLPVTRQRAAPAGATPHPAKRTPLEAPPDGWGSAEYGLGQKECQGLYSYTPAADKLATATLQRLAVR